MAVSVAWPSFSLPRLREDVSDTYHWHNYGTDLPNQRLQLTGHGLGVNSEVVDEPPARAAGN